MEEECDVFNHMHDRDSIVQIGTIARVLEINNKLITMDGIGVRIFWFNNVQITMETVFKRSSVDLTSQ
jgi:hypothetical protein